MTKIPQVNRFPAKVKILRDFYYKPEDAKPSDKPKKVLQGGDLELQEKEFNVLYSVNRVCLPDEYQERVKQYVKPQPKDGNGKKG